MAFIETTGQGNQSLPSDTTSSTVTSTGSGKGSPAGPGGPAALPAPPGGGGLGVLANTSVMAPRNPAARFTP